MKVEKTTKVEKGWGYELIFANENEYCGKVLHFQTGEETSMHYHAIKEETFYVLSGEYEVTMINTMNAEPIEKHLIVGDNLKISRNEPHKIKAIVGGDIIEVSSRDDPLDSYRIQKGSSQTHKLVHIEHYSSNSPIIEGDIDTH